MLKDCSKHFDQKSAKFSNVKKIERSFNSPTVTHMGGAWNQMICSIRRILVAFMTTQTLTNEVLTTLMAEVEGISSRPLVPVTMDSKNEETPHRTFCYFFMAILIFHLASLRKVIAMKSGDGSASILSQAVLVSSDR